MHGPCNASMGMAMSLMNDPQPMTNLYHRLPFFIRNWMDKNDDSNAACIRFPYETALESTLVSWQWDAPQTVRQFDRKIAQMNADLMLLDGLITLKDDIDVARQREVARNRESGPGIFDVAAQTRITASQDAMEPLQLAFHDVSDAATECLSVLECMDLKRHGKGKKDTRNGDLMRHWHAYAQLAADYEHPMDRINALHALSGRMMHALRDIEAYIKREDSFNAKDTISVGLHDFCLHELLPHLKQNHAAMDANMKQLGGVVAHLRTAPKATTDVDNVDHAAFAGREVLRKNRFTTPRLASILVENSGGKVVSLTKWEQAHRDRSGQDDGNTR